MEVVRPALTRSPESTAWRFGGQITRQSQERTKHVYDYRVQLAETPNVRNLKPSLDAFSTETNTVMGAWVLMERSDEEQTGVQSEGAGRTGSSELQKRG